MGWRYSKVYSKTKENINEIAERAKKAKEVDAGRFDIEITRGLLNLVKKDENAFKEKIEGLSGVKLVRTQPIDNDDYCLLLVHLKENDYTWM